MKIKVLIVEDEPPIADLLEEEIGRKLGTLNHECQFHRCVKIAESVEFLKSVRPHVVTLDLKDNATNQAEAGRPAWEIIRDEHFCPVVFFSANPLPGGFPEGVDPFAKYLNKNERKPVDVATTVAEFVPHIEGLQKIRDEVEGRYAKSLQLVSRLIWDSESNPAERAQALLRVTRRRLAATLEHPMCGEDHIKAWEQFIYPPVENCLCTGDVLMRRGGNPNTAVDFRVILSPPCDLVVGPSRHPVDGVLLGRCIPVDDNEILRKYGLVRGARLPEQLAKKLKDDRIEGMLVIPKLAELWPAMILNFKGLEVVGRTTISTTPAAAAPFQFERIASMDSPFREALSWRFTHTVGRPGYPEVDQEALARDIQAAVTPG